MACRSKSVDRLRDIVTACAARSTAKPCKPGPRRPAGSTNKIKAPIRDEGKTEKRAFALAGTGQPVLAQRADPQGAVERKP
jgi:hypothetical protein